MGLRDYVEGVLRMVEEAEGRHMRCEVGERNGRGRAHASAGRGWESYQEQVVEPKDSTSFTASGFNIPKPGKRLEDRELFYCAPPYKYTQVPPPNLKLLITSPYCNPSTKFTIQRRSFQELRQSVSFSCNFPRNPSKSSVVPPNALLLPVREKGI